MTKNFDTLLESILSEMMPATSEFGSGTEMGAAVAKKVPSEKSQHWGPIQKLDDASRQEVINAIIKNVFTDNENNTYSSVIDTPEELKNAIKDAIKEVASSNPAFAKTLGSGKWAVQFLADRLSNKELLGNVKYTTAGGDELKKDVTQKEVKAALNQAVADLQNPEVQKAKIEKGLERTPRAALEGFNPRKEYTLEPISAKILNSFSEEDKKAYDAFESAGAEEPTSGRELYDSLKRHGVTVSEIEKIINKFIRNGYLSTAEETKTSHEEPEFKEGDTGEVPTLDDEEFSLGSHDDLEDYDF
jgi:hypothetical protein